MVGELAFGMGEKEGRQQGNCMRSLPKRDG